MKTTKRDNFRVVVEPRSLGNLGMIRVSDRFFGRTDEDVEKDYEQRCKEICEDVKRHADNVRSAEVEWDEQHVCSCCGREWEESQADDDPECPKGMPLCCEEAMQEFEKAKSQPATA